MLSEHTINIIKSTAPILQEHGETLTRHFYKRMFAHNPEVVPFFNQANQAAGAQQKALAGAICAYALNIENLGALGGAVELIAQKHASLQIKAEQYPIVGENLLASIREVLGEGATEEIIEAWAQAYGFLADILIQRESQIYVQQEEQPGGWNGFKPFRVVRKEKESSNITSFYLTPADGGELPAFKPGQYITVRFATPCGHTTMRNYSLSDKSGQPYYRISVKREEGKNAETPQGYVSHVLHSDVQVGSVIEVAPPCGEFTLEAPQEGSRPLVLLAGGIGITPLYSMLESTLAEAAGRQVILVHAIVNEDVQPFKAALDTLAQTHANLTVKYRYSEEAAEGVTRAGASSTGLVDKALIDVLVPGYDADYYFCGPAPFMASVYQDLLAAEVPASRIHFEFFGPKQALEAKAA